jgi:hypothetical protein
MERDYVMTVACVSEELAVSETSVNFCRTLQLHILEGCNVIQKVRQRFSL